jgi:hypothetical protein
MQFLHAGRQVQGIPAFPAGGKILSHFKTGGLRFTGDHREGRAFADSVVTGIGMDADQGILCIMHRAGSDRKRVHRDAELVDIGM